MEDPHSSEMEEKPVSDKNPASTVESSSLGSVREVTAEEESPRSGLVTSFLASYNQRPFTSVFLVF